MLSPRVAVQTRELRRQGTRFATRKMERAATSASTNSSPEGDRRPRVVDHSTRDARVAIATVVSDLERHRSRLAVIAARARHGVSRDEQMSLRKECLAIRLAIHQARLEVLENLMDAPPKVAAHSRVVDVEKALDNLERALSETVPLL